MKGGIFNDQFLKFKVKSVLKKVNFKSKKLKEEQKMKLYLKILFMLAVMFIVTYRIIVAMDTEKADKKIMDSIRENFSGSIPGKSDESGYKEIRYTTPSNFMLKDNSCSMLY